jgi:hypothetical protein
LDIEAAKLVPIFLAAALLLGVYGVAVGWGLDRIRAAAIATMAAANPVISAQLFSRMNDGQMAASFALMVLFIAVWLRDRPFVFALAAAAVAFYGLNLKFSAVPLFIILSILILAISAWLWSFATALRASTALAVTGVVGVLLLGFHAYVTNTVDHYHPFYPVMGEGGDRHHEGRFARPN